MENRTADRYFLPNKSIFIPHDVVLKESKNYFLKNLVITCIGLYNNAYRHSVKRDGIDEYVMHYCTSGKGWVEIGGRKWTVDKGDAFFCDIDIPHSYGADEREPWTVYWVHFKGEGVPALFKLLDVSAQSPVFHIGERAKINLLINEIFVVLSSGYNLSHLLHSSTCFQEILSYIANLHLYLNLKDTNETGIENIINFMLENIESDFTLKQFADYANMSEFHFARKFKQKVGYSPAEYFNRLKIQKACELLDTSCMSIKEISSFLAYNNQYYFSEVFKRIIGYSPKKYRNLQRLNFCNNAWY